MLVNKVILAIFSISFLISCSSIQKIEEKNFFGFQKCMEGFEILNLSFKNTMSNCLKIDTRTADMMVRWLEKSVSEDNYCRLHSDCKNIILEMNDEATFIKNVKFNMTREEVLMVIRDSDSEIGEYLFVISEDRLILKSFRQEIL